MELEPMMNTLVMLLLPAVLAILSALTSKKIYMLIAFFWSFPISLYFLMTSSIFALFGITCFTYFVSFIIMWMNKQEED
ncbi:hypothetical protein [Oceanobacillus bengalensis]|uniref:hypothetical protein n=1 Tax=Oceanobacillus bengalensis TaxID=1435466 RepID=UPI003637C14A